MLFIHNLKLINLFVITIDKKYTLAIDNRAFI